MVDVLSLFCLRLRVWSQRFLQLLSFEMDFDAACG